MNRFFLVALALCFAPTPAFGQEEPEAPVAVEESAEAPEAASEEPEAPAEAEETGEEIAADFNEAAEDVSSLVKALESKNWPVGAGFVLMLLVFMANKAGLKDKVGKQAVPAVAIGLAVAASCGIALSSGVAMSTALAQGLAAGLAAIGSWEALFKLFLKKDSATES
jgi:hypothetical protein